MSLPKYFCWTRYGVEAGETFDQILARKELERRGNGGLFLWGIGNALGPSVDLLRSRCSAPLVVFSPIRSRPRVADVSPHEVVSWVSGQTMAGELYALPKCSRVTSGIAKGARPRGHYALVCYSDEPLGRLARPELLCFSLLRNMRTGSPIGASQVTAVVERRSGRPSGPEYPATFIANLVAPFFVRLVEAVRPNPGSQLQQELLLRPTDNRSRRTGT